MNAKRGKLLRFVCVGIVLGLSCFYVLKQSGALFWARVLFRDSQSASVDQQVIEKGSPLAKESPITDEPPSIVEMKTKVSEVNQQPTDFGEHKAVHYIEIMSDPPGATFSAVRRNGKHVAFSEWADLRGYPAEAQTQTPKGGARARFLRDLYWDPEVKLWCGFLISDEVELYVRHDSWHHKDVDRKVTLSRFTHYAASPDELKKSEMLGLVPPPSVENTTRINVKLELIDLPKAVITESPPTHRYVIVIFTSDPSGARVYDEQNVNWGLTDEDKSKTASRIWRQPLDSRYDPEDWKFTITLEKRGGYRRRFRFTIPESAFRLSEKEARKHPFEVPVILDSE